ncbi:MAG TPA: cytochrome c family protein [Rhizomicrobium sp.]|nr:cytochrome c family protein [Rhizomicrobium sp.]
MDSFEWNKIIGAVLGTAIFIFVVRQVAEVIYEPEVPAKPGYVVEGVAETASGAATAPVAEVMPDWGTVLPAADVATGKTISVKCEQCHDLSKGGPNKIGPNLYGVVDRPRATHPGFDYSSAMKAKGGNWTYDELFKFLKSPGSYIPGTKMSFAGLSKESDRINLIAYLRSNADSPAAIPAPAPKTAAPAAAPAGNAPASGAATGAASATAPAATPAPAGAGKAAETTAPSGTTKAATPAPGAANAQSAPAAPATPKK